MMSEIKSANEIISASIDSVSVDMFKFQFPADLIL